MWYSPDGSLILAQRDPRHTSASPTARREVCAEATERWGFLTAAVGISSRGERGACTGPDCGAAMPLGDSRVSSRHEMPRKEDLMIGSLLCTAAFASTVEGAG